MSGKPLYRGCLGDIYYSIEAAMRGLVYLDISEDEDDFEVWRAGDRPVPPTRDQVREDIEADIASELKLALSCDDSDEANDFVHDLTRRIMALLSGGLPTEEDTHDGPA